MKKIAKIMGVTLIALAAKTAMASPLYDQSNTFYIPLSFGAYLPQQPGQSLYNATYASIGLGYNINNLFGVQTQVGFTAPTTPGGNGRPDTTIWTVEGRLNAANHTAFTPYLLAGIGTLTNTSGTSFVQDYGLGIDFKLSPTVSIGISGKEVMQESPSWQAETIVTGNFTWYFGGNKKVVQPAVQMPIATEQQQMLQTAQTTLKPILPNGVHMCKNNKLGNEAGCVTFNGDNMVMHLNIHFKQNQTSIQNQFNTPVASLGTFMNAYPNTTVVLYGYASSEGPAKFNQTISKQRANAVKQYLVQTSKIQSSRIQIVAMGSKNPVASNATLKGRQENRRVEAKVPVPYKADH
jgi:OOP family OmpA-OmpF porin